MNTFILATFKKVLQSLALAKKCKHLEKCKTGFKSHSQIICSVLRFHTLTLASLRRR